MVDIKKHFGTKLKQIRNNQKLSQEELAFRSGLHRTYISDIERGVRNVSLENIQKIAKALDVNISSLFSPKADGRS